MTISTIESVNAMRGLLEAESGLEASLESLRAAYFPGDRRIQEWAVEFTKAPAGLHDRAAPPRYPQIQVYCDQIESRRTERLRAFSGVLRMVVELRLSQDRLEGLTEQVLLYVDAVRDVIERNTGCVEGKFFVQGEYEVEILPVEHGGLNYLQKARVKCPVLVNRD